MIGKVFSLIKFDYFSFPKAQLIDYWSSGFNF
jgi:hypothetical protein